MFTIYFFRTVVLGILSRKLYWIHSVGISGGVLRIQEIIQIHNFFEKMFFNQKYSNLILTFNLAHTLNLYISLQDNNHDIPLHILHPVLC
jgi:hypothetical protein